MVVNEGRRQKAEEIREEGREGKKGGKKEGGKELIFIVQFTTALFLKLLALGFLRGLDTHLVISEKVGLATPEKISPFIPEVDELTQLIVSTIDKFQK